MRDVAALIADMVRAGVDPDLIGRTAETIAQATSNAPAPKTARQERNARYYQKKASEKRLNKTDQDVSDDLPSPQGSSPTPPSPKPLPSNPPSPPKGGSSPIDRAIEIFSEEAKRANLPAPRKVTADRRRKIEARLREHGESVWAEACRKMADSAFCRGENDRGWRADLDFLCQPKSFNGLIEGKYDDRPSQRTTDPPQRGVMGAARRILESEGNGSESIFGNLGDGEFLSPARGTGQRDASADIPGSFAGLRLVGHR